MKQRENNRWIDERKNSKGKLLCLIPTCNKLREKYKTSNNTRNYCKDHTFLDMGAFTNWQSLREKVLKRDNYTCVECGDKRKEVEIMTKHRRCINLERVYKRLDKKFEYEWVERKEVRNNLIADHIIPIALGGSEWDMKNIQTLCLKCNKIKTKKDMKDIAKQRRINKKLVDKQEVLK